MKSLNDVCADLRAGARCLRGCISSLSRSVIHVMSCVCVTMPSPAWSPIFIFNVTPLVAGGFKVNNGNADLTRDKVSLKTLGRPETGRNYNRTSK